MFINLIKQRVKCKFPVFNQILMILFCRGFTVETCIVVQHVGGGSTNSPGTSPVAKKPCPPVQVIVLFHNFLFPNFVMKEM